MQTKIQNNLIEKCINSLLSQANVQLLDSIGRANSTNYS